MLTHEVDRISRLTFKTPFLQAGLDSLAAVELRNLISTRFTVSLPATLVFDYPSLSAIASLVQSTLAGRQALGPQQSKTVGLFDKVEMIS